MHRRILFGVAAWLLGAATATAGSLLAVSLLGQGITGTSGPLLTQDAVNRALASESGEPAATPTATATPRAGGTAGTATRTRPAGPSAGPSGGASPSDTPPASPAPSATASASTAGTGTSGTGTSGTGTVLASRGGDVVASCVAAGAYLDSWSPAQGYLTGAVHRGPAQTARVTFDPASGSDDLAVTLVVSCSAGTPTARTWGTGDE